MSNEVALKSTVSSFAFAAASLSTGIPILRHKRGKFITSDGAELPLGTKMAVHDMIFGVLRFNGAGSPPTKIVAEPGKRLPERHELGDEDPALWSPGPDGKATDPWQEFTEATVTVMSSGLQYALSATAVTARHSMAQLSRQVVWGQRKHGANATPVIELRTHEAQGQKGAYDVPDYPIVEWIPGEEPNNNNVTSLARTWFEKSDGTPPEDSTARTERRASAAATGLEWAQAALQKRLNNTPKDDLDDELLF